ncbi:MAG: ABC1 kinase family protein [Dongiaceae bacterium]
MRERNTLAKRVKRYAKVSSKMGAIAAKTAGQRLLGQKIDHQLKADMLKTALGNLKGPLMKVAQIAATIPDAVPETYANAFLELQSNAPPMGWPFVKRRMEAELGKNWQSKFKSFSPTAAAAASLGQVHQAVAKDGTLLACKLQYPDMQGAVEADLKQLRLLFGIYQSTGGALNTSEVQKEIADRLREELDYKLEARHISYFTQMLGGEKDIHIPKTYPSLSTARLLTMSWLEGKPVLHFLKAPLKERNVIAQRIFRAWYLPFYHYGIIHADPHLGNYSVRGDLGLNLVDFGCVRIFQDKFVQGVLDLYDALYRNKPAQAVAAYESWGFTDLTKEKIRILNMWAEFLYRPIMTDKVMTMDETNSGAYGREMAAKVHQELRKTGGVKPPREFVFMDRAAVGVGSVFLRLRAELNWHQLFQELVADFDGKELGKKQAKLLGPA